MHEAGQAEGPPSMAVEELMALPIGIAVHCEGCVTHHVHDALEALAQFGAETP